MKVETKFASIFMTACTLVFLSLPAFARAASPPQDQGTAQTQSVQKGENQKVGQRRWWRGEGCRSRHRKGRC
jgi:hypothetical protein